jgi:hypothetical protein
VHLPIHASWLNRVEIFFSTVQRKVVKPQDFPDLEVLTERLLAFQDRYDATAAPFDWRFTRKSLARPRQDRRARGRCSSMTPDELTVVTTSWIAVVRAVRLPGQFPRTAGAGWAGRWPSSARSPSGAYE